MSICFFSLYRFFYHISCELETNPADLPGRCVGLAGLFVVGFPSDVPKYFIATVVISVYSEIMARVCKVPVTLFLTTAVLPLVPGGGMYYTMEYCVRGETSLFAETGLHTLGFGRRYCVGNYDSIFFGADVEGDESAKAFSQETILRRQMKNGTGTDCRNFAAGIAG